MKISPLFAFAVVGSLLPKKTYAWEACNATQLGGDGICPDGNTCCPTSVPGVSRCITTKDNTYGTCCLDVHDDNDDDPGHATTGCGQGFSCATNGGYQYCLKTGETDKPAPDQLPRYRLCSLPHQALQQVYGLAVPETNDTYSEPYEDDDEEDDDTNREATPPLLAYYSNMGPVDTQDEAQKQELAHVETAVIVIHGSNRNADDYLCSTHQAVKMWEQRHQQQQTTFAASPAKKPFLVVAPWFLTNWDGPVDLTVPNASDTSTIRPLRWAEDGPIWHTWRYGADALNAAVSSYDAVDALIEQLLPFSASSGRNDALSSSSSSSSSSSLRFPRLRRIVLVGHSAGGQYVQRWALLSHSRVFDFAAPTASTSASAMATEQKQLRRSRLLGGISMRMVVANPKCFAYLDGRRYFDDGTNFRLPNTKELDNCPSYNEWQWGLGEGDYLPTPYKDRAVARAAHEHGGSTHEEGVQALVARYAQRHVVYLSGQQDTEPNGSTCMEFVQGDYRRQRAARYMASLDQVYGGSHKHTHHRLVVAGVHHDHCLMFQSPEGQQAMFGFLGTSLGTDRSIESMEKI